MCSFNDLPKAKKLRLDDILASNPSDGSVDTFKTFLNNNDSVNMDDVCIFMTDERNIILDWNDTIEIEFLNNLKVKVSTDFIDRVRYELADSDFKTLLINKGIINA